MKPGLATRLTRDAILLAVVLLGAVLIRSALLPEQMNIVKTGDLKAPMLDGAWLRLDDGRFFVFGATAPQSPNETSESGTAEIYDPKRGEWSMVPGKLNNFQFASALSGGRVICGFSNKTDDYYQLYNTTDKNWSNIPTPPGKLATYTALDCLQLKSGELLFVGDSSAVEQMGEKTCAEYNLKTRTWKKVGDLIHIPSQSFGMILEDNGKVLKFGIDGEEEFDPASYTWSSSVQRVSMLPGQPFIRSLNENAETVSWNVNTHAELNLGIRSSNAPATILKSGRIWGCGGFIPTHQLLVPIPLIWLKTEPDALLSDSWLFDPATNHVQFGSLLPEPRSNHTLITLDDGRVVVCGGVLMAAFNPNKSNDPINPSVFNTVATRTCFIVNPEGQ